MKHFLKRSFDFSAALIALILVVEEINPGAKILSINGHYENPIDIPTEETIEDLLRQGPIYVVTAMKGYCPQFMLENYDFVPKGPLYQAVVRK